LDKGLEWLHVEKQTVLDRKLPYDRDVRGCCLRAVSLWKKIPIILVNKAVDEKKRKGSEEEVKNLGLPTYKNIFFFVSDPIFPIILFVSTTNVCNWDDGQDLHLQ
jgi:hypothetical protein